MRIVIGEDEALLRAGLILLLEEAGFEVAGVASDAPMLVQLASGRRP
jgi:DNA-binding NarL/FixJ family response regulator